MIPKNFPEANCVFKKPNGFTDEQCGDLPTFMGTGPDGVAVIISCWALTKEDIEAINQNGVIYLTIVGIGMPPVSLGTENPFKYKDRGNSNENY